MSTIANYRMCNITLQPLRHLHYLLCTTRKCNNTCWAYNTYSTVLLLQQTSQLQSSPYGVSLRSNCLLDHVNGVGTQGPPLTLGELALSLELLHASSELLDVSILGRRWVKVIPKILIQTKPKGKAQVKRKGGRDRVARLQLLVSFVSS